MDEVLRHIDERIAAAKISLWPYPHVSVPEIFPREVYAAMEADLPDKRQFLSELTWMPQMGRFEFGPAPEARDVARVWYDRYYPLIVHVNTALIAKFTPLIAVHMKRLHAHGVIASKDVPLVQGQATVCYMENGWDQSPHLHSMGEVLQSFVYFPVAGSTEVDNEKLGTLMFRFKRPFEWSEDHPDGKPCLDEDNPERVAQAPYADNLLFCFLNTPASPHGAPIVAGAKDRRYIFIKVALPLDALIGNPTQRVRSNDFVFQSPREMVAVMTGLMARLRRLPKKSAIDALGRSLTDALVYGLRDSRLSRSMPGRRIAGRLIRAWRSSGTRAHPSRHDPS